MFNLLLALFIGFIFFKFLFALGIGLTKIIFGILGFVIVLTLFPLGLLSIALFLPLILLIGIVSIVGFIIKLLI